MPWEINHLLRMPSPTFQRRTLIELHVAVLMVQFLKQLVTFLGGIFSLKLLNKVLVRCPTKPAMVYKTLHFPKYIAKKYNV